MAILELELQPGSRTNHVEAAAAPPEANTTLPNEILWQIWAHVDDPRSLSLASKRFRELSQDALWRAQWLMQRYEPFRVVFEAIARPRLCSAALIRGLRQLGASLTVNVVQLLQVIFNARERAKDWGEDGGRLYWGVNIKFSAYGAVMDWAAEVFKDGISFEIEDLESLKFSDWMTNEDELHKDTEEDPEPDDQVRKLFSNGFMPLGVSFVRSDEYDEDSAIVMIGRPEDEVTAAIINDPVLLDAAIENGYRVTAARTEKIIDGWHKAFVVDKDQLKLFVERLKVNGIVQLRRQYVRRTITQCCNLRQQAPAGGYDKFSIRVSLPSLKASRLLERTEAIGAIILKLDKERALSFTAREACGLDPKARHESQPSSSAGRKRKAGDHDTDDEASDAASEVPEDLETSGASKKARLDVIEIF